jgi:hypothetical protein
MTNPESFRFSLHHNQTLLDSRRGNLVGTEEAMGCRTEESWFSSQLLKGMAHGSRAHTASYSRSTGGSFPGDKASY